MKKLIFVALISVVMLVSPVLTRASISDDIAALQKQIVSLQTRLADLLKQQKQVNGFCHDFNVNLKTGDVGYNNSDHADDVYALNQILSDKEGLFTYEEPMTLTRFMPDEVQKFQTKYGIPATGYVGPLTRAKLNELYGCSKKVFITPNALKEAKIGELYSEGIKLHGFADTRSVGWKVAKGNLPPGLEMRAIAGPSPECVTGQICPAVMLEYKDSRIIFGTPTKSGTYTFTVQATNGTQTATQTYTLTVKEAEKISDITVASPNGGEKWVTYDTEDIKWNWPNAKRTDKVDLYLDPEPPACVNQTPACMVKMVAPYVLDKNISARATYNWIVATDINNKLISSGNYRVRVCKAGTNACDASDDYFTITAPAHLMQLCPDEKVINKMPTVGSNAANSTYFIMNGTRWELEHFDLDWVTRNCSVKEQTVY